MNRIRQNENWFVIIMAGGSGERFWPLSRRKQPKQLLKLLGKESFLQQTVRRTSSLVNNKNIFVITNIEQATAVRKQLPQLPSANIITEPCGRDTCAAVTLGAALVGARSTTGVMAVLPADHIILEEEKFISTLRDSFEIASRGQVTVTIGIKPSEAHTGFGYIRVGEPLPIPAGLNISTTFHKAEQFVEKPNYEKAIEYLNSGKYRWNAGMFIWSFVTITEGLQKYQPEFYNICQRWFALAPKPAALKKQLNKDYPDLKKISIDYALMEKAQNVVVADGEFRWDDVGSWTALYKHLPHDENGNAVSAEKFIYVDASKNLVFDARKKNKTLIANVGLQDSILVLTDDAILVAHKSQAQKVKELVKKLGENKEFKKML